MEMCHELKKKNYHIYFFKHEFLTYCAISPHETLHTAEICLERCVSQNFDIGLSFCFMVFRKRNLWKKCKNSRKFFAMK